VLVKLGEAGILTPMLFVARRVEDDEIGTLFIIYCVRSTYVCTMYSRSYGRPTPGRWGPTYVVMTFFCSVLLRPCTQL